MYIWIYILIKVVNKSPILHYRPDDAAKAFQQSIERVFFGKKIQVERHDGYDATDEDFKPPEAELDEYHHKSTRTLFVGNLEVNIDPEILRDVFRHYGNILVSFYCGLDQSPSF